MIKTNIMLDVSRIGLQGTIQGIRKGEVNMRCLVFSLHASGTPIEIPVGAIAELYVKKADGSVTYSSCIVEGGSIKHILTSQECAAPGIAHCELRVQFPAVDNESVPVLYSPCFALIVEDTIYTEHAVVSSDEDTVWTDTLARISAIETELAESDIPTKTSELSDDAGLGTTVKRNVKAGMTKHYLLCAPEGNGDVSSVFYSAQLYTKPSTGRVYVGEDQLATLSDMDEAIALSCGDGLVYDEESCVVKADLATAIEENSDKIPTAGLIYKYIADILGK